ncbi:MAG: TrmB family transcriptional regulator [Candidatus Thermoplasmatota archaeon]|nr:TrmB family transcriptional regulator [Candidatus Thermoplasmatota archaeon]MCL5790699.1 TrmB family transcriptional regulator [Candidatus Thermoplasmatota archaeon]
MSEDPFENLKKFGLTSYEIKVYKAIALKGPLTSTEAVQYSGIPQPRVYDVISRLLARSLIEFSPGKKRVYKARNIEESLKNEIDVMERSVSEISKQIEMARKRSGSSDPYLWMIQSERKIKSEMRKNIDEAAEEIMLSISYDELKFLAESIKSAVGRGVTVVVVLFPDSEGHDLSFLQGTIVRRRNGPATETLITDRKSVILRIDKGRKELNYAIYADENEIVHMSSYYFYHTIWKPSSLIEGGVAFNDRNFNTGWLACWYINEAMKQGFRVQAEIEGKIRGVDTRMTGSVLEVRIEDGFRHSFLIRSRNRKLWVGGRSARIEDVAMYSCLIRIK